MPGDCREVEVYGYGQANIWILENTDAGYTRVLPLSRSEEFVVVPTELMAVKVKALLLPELLTNTDKRLLGTYESYTGDWLDSFLTSFTKNRFILHAKLRELIP